MQDAFHISIEFDLCATFIFGITGALVALRRGYDIVGLFALAFVTGVGGGLLRDLLVRDEPLLLKPGQFYALAALAGCLLFFILAVYFKIPAPRAGLITVAATFVFRVLAIQFNWRTPPLYRPDTPGEERSPDPR
jgi:uncharacterized membrane protein YeiH